MVNGYDQIYVERARQASSATSVAFIDEAHLMRIIDRIVSQVGRRIDETSPMVDARLPDGSRVNAIIPPLALDGPTLTIRKFSRDALTRWRPDRGSARSTGGRRTSSAPACGGS